MQKCTNQKPTTHSRPLNCSLLIHNDILAHFWLFFCCCVRPSAHPFAEAAVSRLPKVLLSNRPAHENATGLWITNSLSARVGSAGRMSRRQTKEEAQTYNERQKCREDEWEGGLPCGLQLSDQQITPEAPGKPLGCCKQLVRPSLLSTSQSSPKRRRHWWIVWGGENNLCWQFLVVSAKEEVR